MVPIFYSKNIKGEPIHPIPSTNLYLCADINTDTDLCITVFSLIKSYSTYTSTLKYQKIAIYVDDNSTKEALLYKSQCLF